MRYEIVLTDTAKRHYRALSARLRATVRDGLEAHLGHEPGKVSRSRIKRLRGPEQPEYRLRLGEHRVFCDVDDRKVIVLAIVPKDDSDSWLDKNGVSSR